ncbi:ras-related protein Ral-a isoform X1 [Balamuthia mandrillaris]
MAEYKIVVVGEGAVGKSSLCLQLVQNVFLYNYDATIEDTYRKRFTIDEEECKTNIRLCENGQGFLLVYSIVDRKSFEALPSIREEILRIKDKDDIPLTIAGNKIDLHSAEEAGNGEEGKKVGSQEGVQLAKSFGCPLIETSAKTRENVEACFFQLVREIKRSNNEAAEMVTEKRKRCLLS